MPRNRQRCTGRKDVLRPSGGKNEHTVYSVGVQAPPGVVENGGPRIGKGVGINGKRKEGTGGLRAQLRKEKGGGRRIMNA